MNEDNRLLYSPNKHINAAIIEMMNEFDKTSQLRMAKAIKAALKAALKHQDGNTDSEARHIFREFIPAYILNQHGFSMQYEEKVDGKTPDWLDGISRILMESYTYERTGTSKFPTRVITAIDNKCIKYNSIASNHNFGILISIYLDFITGIDFDDCHYKIKEFAPLFIKHPRLAGVIFFTETNSGSFRIGNQPYGAICFSFNDRLLNHTTFPIPIYNIDCNFEH